MIRLRWCLMACVVMLSNLLAPAMGTAAAEPVLALTPFASGFEQPVGMVDDGSSTLYVIERGGLIWQVTDGHRAATPFLDVRDRVSTGNMEQGLLGLAFPPDYATSHLFYVDYTGTDGGTVVARYSVRPGDTRADAADEEIILQQAQPYPNHNGGQLAFGPDGYLYIGMGDGGSAGDPNGNGQANSTRLGKILRIDVTPTHGSGAGPYTIPDDNPFIGLPGASPDAWAIGLRNPWRFSFDQRTGDLWIGDVGQDAYEEIDWLPAGTPGGVNFGWNVREGTHCYAKDPCDGKDLVDPVLEYSHAEGGCSVTGGYVIRQAGSPLNGTYVYGDYCSGLIWTATVQNGKVVARSGDPLESGLQISSFAQGADGEVYVIDIGGGSIYAIGAAS